MAKYRKKPIVIEAWKWPENEVPEAKISMIDSDFNWTCKECGHLAHEHGNCPTLEGYHIVCPGDMIIKGVKGDFYPCKPDIFEMTYEKVESGGKEDELDEKSVIANFATTVADGETTKGNREGKRGCAMRLMDADVLKSKIREQPWKQETKVSLMLDLIYMLIDEASTVSTVQNKALQQENEQLRAKLDEWKYEAKCHMDEVIAREKQIEQLRAQVARMREALKQAWKAIYDLRYTLNYFKNKSGLKPYDNMTQAQEALAEIDRAIGGEKDD